MPRQGASPPFASERFARFLERKHVVVLDVVRGASSETRRLLVGDEQTGRVTHTVAVAEEAEGRTPLDVEQDVLTSLHERLRPELARTLPRVVERVEVTETLSGLVLTAVPGLRAPVRTRAGPATRSRVSPVVSWLATLWEDTGQASAQVSLGGEAARSMLARYSGSTRLASVLDSVQRARHVLAELETPRTATHGCLCPRHTKTEQQAVVGVDDWGLSALSSEPLRDLGHFCVRLADKRLPEVVAGRTAYATALREFLVVGLSRHRLPRHVWREVLVLTQLELAVAALDRGDTDGVALLVTAVRELPAQRRRNEARH